MKLRTSFLLTIAFAATVLMSSCVRNYTCHCVISYAGQPGLPDTTAKEYTVKDTESGAKNKCSSNSGTYTNNGITTTEDCTVY